MMTLYKSKENTYLKGYKIQIFPNEYQKAYIERCFELVRYVWNWALEIEENQYKMYKEGLSDQSFLIDKELLALYREKRESDIFLTVLDYEATRFIIRHLVNSYELFFKKKIKHPKFKSRKRSPDYVPLRYDTTYLVSNILKIPGLKTKILTNQQTDYNYRKDNPTYYNCKITKDIFGNYWFNYSLLTEINYNYFKENNIPQSEVIGIDLNVDNTITCSNGIVYKKPNFDKINKRIKKCQRAVNKDVKILADRQEESERTNSAFELLPGENAKKRLIKLNKATNKKANIMQNFVYQSVSDIVKRNPKAIVVEDLHVEEMLGSHYIAKHINDCNFANIRERLKQKCEQFNITFVVADRYFKSSQICSECGSINKYHSNYHTYHCKKCGNKIDRDLNAAKNLANYYDYSFEIIA